jgi:LysM repeat protein
MEAVRAALLTQTAQAANAGADYTATPTVVDATETPVLVPTQESITATPSSENLTPTEASGATIEYIVQHGDWLYSIAYNFNVDPEDIIQLNDLQAPYELDTGQVLLIPTEGSSGASPTNTALAGGTDYTVLAGEWVYSIARKFGVEPQAIIDLNGLVYPFTLYPGDVIKIP